MMMIYLWVDAVLYSVFGVRCTLTLKASCMGIGYERINSGSTSEYQTVYGWLQLGLALFMGWCAYSPSMQKTLILLALMLYAPIVIFRWLSIATVWPVSASTLSLGTLESGWLVWYVDCWLRDFRS